MAAKRIGLIGAGNMGSAILRGMLDAGYVKASQVAVCDTSRRKLEELSQEMPSVTFCEAAVDLVEQSDMVILAIKPHYLAGVLAEIGGSLAGKAVISIAAGWTVSMLEDALQGTGATYLRVMPNTPAMVGEGMTALCDDSNFSKEDFAFAKGIFDAVGRTVILPERLFDGVIAISGSSPAYVFMMLAAFLRLRNGSAVRAGQRADGSAIRHPSGQPEGRGLFARWDHHRSRGRAGTQGLPCRHHGRYGGLRGKIPSDVPIKRHVCP